MPVELRLYSGKLRTCEVATGRPSLNQHGTPVDGGGWPNTKQGRSVGERQIGYINGSLKQKGNK